MRWIHVLILTPFVSIFYIVDPDPQSSWIRIQYVSGSTTLGLSCCFLFLQCTTSMLLAGRHFESRKNGLELLSKMVVEVGRKYSFINFRGIFRRYEAKEKNFRRHIFVPNSEDGSWEKYLLITQQLAGVFYNPSVRIHSWRYLCAHT